MLSPSARLPVENLHSSSCAGARGRTLRSASLALLVLLAVVFPSHGAEPGSTAKLKAANLLIRSDGSAWSCCQFQASNRSDSATLDPKAWIVQIRLDNIVDIAWAEHGVAVNQSGEMFGWGSNRSFQLGDDHGDRKTVERIEGISGVKAVAIGPGFTLALKQDGTVWSWGDNRLGQLGDGSKLTAAPGRASPTGRAQPTDVKGLPGVVQIAAGRGHALALDRSGTVWSWGANDFGQLGNGSNGEALVPVHVKDLVGVRTIAAGDDFSVALMADGTVRTWGRNDEGQLGDETAANCNVPLTVKHLDRVTAVVAAVSRTMALREDGTVWVWGLNSYKRPGHRRYTPEVTKIEEISGVQQIAANEDDALIMKDDGSLWFWGTFKMQGLRFPTIIDRPRRLPAPW
jgi:alpha-tubulin suppressor-like RCC1 family protein